VYVCDSSGITIFSDERGHTPKISRKCPHRESRVTGIDIDDRKWGLVSFEFFTKLFPDLRNVTFPRDPNKMSVSVIAEHLPQTGSSSTFGLGDDLKVERTAENS